MGTSNVPFRDGSSLQIEQGGAIGSYGYFDGVRTVRWLVYRNDYTFPRHDNDAQATFTAGPPIWYESEYLVAVKDHHGSHSGAHPATPGILHGNPPAGFLYIKGHAEDRSRFPSSLSAALGADAPDFPSTDVALVSGADERKPGDPDLHWDQIWTGHFELTVGSTVIGQVGVLELGSAGNVRQHIEWYVTHATLYKTADRIGGRKREGAKHDSHAWTVTKCSRAQSNLDIYNQLKDFHDSLGSNARVSAISCNGYPSDSWPREM